MRITILPGFIFLGGLIVSLFSACLKMTQETEDGTPSGTVLKLNRNVTGLRNLANACMSVDSIAIFNIQYNGDGSLLYWLNMKEGGDIELYSEIVSEEILVPELSMDTEDGVFYWTVNGVFLTDSEGNRVSVTDLTKPISFLLLDNVIRCKVNNTLTVEYPVTKADDYLVRDVKFDYDSDNRACFFRLSSGFRTSLPTISDYHLLNENVLNRSYYKDVFLDAGIALTSIKSLAAVDHLDLSVEGISFSSWDPASKESVLQEKIIAGDSDDFNGRLLYPDGQPRYKLLFVNGGLSYDHGKSLGEKGLKAMRTFVKNGGCYVGSCAGAFFASNGYNGRRNYIYYLSVWPGMMRYTNLEKTYTGMFIEKDSPLLRYYDFGGDFSVDSIWHNTGGYPEDFPLKTEILARYDYPKKTAIHRKPSIWAYKESHLTGRIVLTGSHPEIEPEGERCDLTTAMFKYAMDGGGVVSLKGCLKNGEKRVMDKNTSDNDPAYTRIGDLQTHHFATYIPSGAKNIRVEVSSDSHCDFALMMNQGSYAFSDTAEYCSTNSGATQHLFFPSLKEGFWFIGVKCLTTVTVVETDYGQAYSGHTEVLNGIPYQVSICWD